MEVHLLKILDEVSVVEEEKGCFFADALVALIGGTHKLAHLELFRLVVHLVCSDDSDEFPVGCDSEIFAFARFEIFFQARLRIGKLGIKIASGFGRACPFTDLAKVVCAQRSNADTGNA